MDEFNTTNTPQPAAHPHFPKPILWIVGVIIILGLLWIFVWSRDSIMMPDGPFVEAPEGGVVSNFPSELMPNDGWYIEHSYSARGEGEISYESPVITFESPLDRALLVTEYTTKLENAGWTITTAADETSTEAVVAIHAMKDDARASVVMQDKLSGAVAVTVSVIMDAIDACIDGACDDDLVVDETLVSDGDAPQEQDPEIGDGFDAPAAE